MNTQKGFAPILLILVGLIVIGGGIYFYVKNKVVEQKNSEQIIATSTKTVKEEPVIAAKINTSLSDKTVDKLLESMKTVEFKGELVKVNVGFSNITKGDINGDGYEDVLFISTTCGVSCGSSLSAIINLKNDTGKIISLDEENYIRTSSAAQTEITGILINNSVISITANGFIGVEPWNKSVTKKFKVENETLVEI